MTFGGQGHRSTPPPLRASDSIEPVVATAEAAAAAAVSALFSLTSVVVDGFVAPEPSALWEATGFRCSKLERRRGERDGGACGEGNSE